MRTQAPIVLFLLLIVAVAPASAQREGHDGPSVRMLEFMVRNGNYIKDIAARIKVPARAIVRANKLHSRHYLAYPGRKLYIPVPVQPKVWDPTREDMTGNSPSREDRGGTDDYELVIDSSNYSLSEDFINISEAISDSIEYENITAHIRKIEKRIGILNYRIDSLKEADFKFDNDDQDKNSVMSKLKIARDKYYAESPQGKQIDSLQAEKLWLGQRRIILSNQITEYEYLAENANYSAKNYRHDEKDKPSNWGDHLAYESNYVKDRSTAFRKPVTPSHDTIVKAPAHADKEAGISAINNDKPAPPEPAKTTSKVAEDRPRSEVIPQAPDAPPPAMAQTAAPVENAVNDTAASDEDFPHYMSDFSLLPRKILSSEIYASRARTLLLFNPEPAQMAAIKAGKEPAAKPENPASTQPVTDAGDRAAGEAAKPKLQPTIEETPHGTATVISDNVRMTLKSKMDTVTEKTAPGVNTDPLAHYKSDSDFVSGSVPVKAVPVTEHKNRPRYLIPADTVTRTKGEFYLLRARQELEKGDFKSGDKFLRKSLDIDPNDAQAWMLHADLFLTMGLADQALKEYLISGEIDSTNPKVFYNIALLYSKANDHQKAYKYFTRAIDVNPKYLLAYMGRASLEMDEHDYDGAVLDYDKVLMANKYYGPAFKARGLAKMEQRKFADAIKDFNQYLEIEDPDGYVLYQRGISKIFSDNLLQGCLDLSSAHELGFKDADKAIKKFCE